jgi:5-methylcytosine-specific restriction protein A
LDLTTRDNATYQYWHVLAYGQPDGRQFVWQLRPELVEALHQLRLLTAKELPLAEEVSGAAELFEGAKRQVFVNAFERNTTARQLCVRHYGARCQVCGFDFESVYGAIGAGFIHVHHLRELSEIGSAYKVDPVQDLRPVCPNCHAMLHRESPALTIEALKTRLRR